MIREHLDGQVTEQQRDNVLLLASELVTNSVIHARSACRLSVHLTGAGTVRLEAHDLDPSPPHPADCSNGDVAESGRGLFLVEAIAADWGHCTNPAGGKSVWCDIAP